ncbi:methylated-DNA--[protein]-cysteine S-methyltransferase [Streptomyces puniciscabiei]|uniref:methylated-DNA--[protein]-cysteine S-methyltransferase n=1 Tax=Streptomyces puniciscabiei TaxID=164348 RepID=UPI0037AA0B2B
MRNRARQRATPAAVHVCVQPTAIGPLTLAVAGDALVYCGFATPLAVRRRMARTAPDWCVQMLHSTVTTSILQEVTDQLQAFLDGRSHGFSLPLDLRLASVFTQQVLTAVDSLAPYGRTATYGELAAALGRPRAARAVGTALGANPLCVVLPCHRIVGSTGRLTGYAGGLRAKRYLLDLEESAGHSAAADRLEPGTGAAALPSGFLRCGCQHAVSGPSAVRQRPLAQ